MKLIRLLSNYSSSLLFEEYQFLAFKIQNLMRYQLLSDILFSLWWCIVFPFDVKIVSESPQSILKRFIKPYDIESLGLVKLIELLDRDIRNLRLSICILKAKKKSIFPEKITFTIFVLFKPMYTYLFCYHISITWKALSNLSGKRSHGTKKNPFSWHEWGYHIIVEKQALYY